MFKRAFVIIATFMAIASVALALYGTGGGKILAATTTPQELAGFTANSVSVYNTGAVTLFCLVDCTTNDFTTRLAAGTTLPIPAGTSYTFNAETQTSIERLWYATTNSTAEVFVGRY